MRDGKTSNLFANPKYDLNFQNLLEIEPFKLYKNDTIVLKCNYDTTARKHTTFVSIIIQSFFLN